MPRLLTRADRLRRFVIAAFGLLALSSPSFAGKEIYTCEINERHAVTPSGHLRDATRGALGSTMRGMQFVVVRETGRVQGDAPVGQGIEPGPRVLQRGDEETFFIAMYLGKKRNFTSLEAIWVEESAPARRKPFMAVEAGFVYTGICE